jgi:ATP synthase protein I
MVSTAQPGPDREHEHEPLQPRPLPLHQPRRRRHESLQPREDTGQPREGTGWAIVSYLVGGMVLYGGIGWLAARWTHIDALFPIGILLGIGLSLALVVFRFTRV